MQVVLNLKGVGQGILGYYNDQGWFPGIRNGTLNAEWDKPEKGRADVFKFARIQQSLIF